MKLNNLKLGPSEGNRGAVIRWGKHWDNGFWFTPIQYSKLWLRPKFMRRYIRIGPFNFRWGNK